MATIHWKQGINGHFETATNWSTNTVPGPNDDVAIDAPGTYTVTASTNRTIRSLTTAGTATLAITGGRFTITNGTGIGTSAGTVSVANGAALAVAGHFDNSGKIALTPHGRNTDLIIAGNVSLTGGGEITLSSGDPLIGSSAIVGVSPSIPVFLLNLFPFLANLLPFLPVATLTNTDNTIDGAGVIGPNLRLVNAGNVIGNSTLAALELNTGTRTFSNSGLMEGTTDQGLVIFGNLANTGTLAASGEAARLVIDGTVTNSGAGANITASGGGAHVDLARATITGGAVSIGESGVVQSRLGSGASVISRAALTGTGILQADTLSALSVTNSSIDPNLALMSNGYDSLLSIDGTVGANAATIAGGAMEFKGPSAANITFAQGQVGSLKPGPAFTGTVSGFAGNQPVTFTNFFAFGDSTIDTGALQYLSQFLPSPTPNPGLTHRLSNALANGGTDSPVGVGSMNTQLLAADFGLSANTAYMTGGAIGGGGTNYAISGALDAADPGSGADPGNGSISNINQAKTGQTDPHILSTVDQMQAYLNSVSGQADASALYLISSGGNDVSYALNTFIGDQATQQAYLSAQAQSLASEIELLYHDGAQHIMVNNSMSDNPLASFYSQQLFADLDSSGISYIKSDVHAMVDDVIANPTAYGFTATTVHRGVAGLATESALIEPDTTHNLHGWGLWGANTTVQESGVQSNFEYSYLSSPNAEQTHFFSDDQHLSAAGQQIQANLDYNLLVDDSIDLTTLPYAPGQTTASFAGSSANGTLTVSDGTQNVKIALLGDYTGASFMTAGDGTGGTLVLDQTNPAPQVPATLQK